jgi:hypothetical protein
MTFATGARAREALEPCVGQRIDEPQSGTSLGFGLLHVFVLGVIARAMFTSPWPAPLLIGLASIPVLFVMRWQWRVLRGPQLHVEDLGVRIIAPAGDVLVVWDAMQLAEPFSAIPRGFASPGPRLIEIRFAGTDGRPARYARPIRSDAPVRWALLE